MQVNKLKSLSKRLVSGLLTGSMMISALSLESFTVSANNTTQNDLPDTSLTILVDEDGNIVQTTGGDAYNKDGDSITSSKDDVEYPVPENTLNVDTEISTITFDKYYSLIDTNAIQTDTLLVKTEDENVFTDNTEIVSNYEDVYIISFDSVAEARSAYSYYNDKVDYISDLSNVFTLALDNPSINEGDDAIANLNDININKNYSGYIALIDSGVNNGLANAYLSVFDDDGKDTNGHGTAMAGYIRQENPDAKILSIKAFEGHTTNVANIYAAIKLAIESKVSVINLSLAGYDTEQNAIIKDVIREALSAGIVVIGAAGNYNSSALNYIPGSIEDVIVVGAVNSNFTKYSSSNYDADVYVVATSTSEATAKYTGMYTANNIDSKRVTKTLTDENQDGSGSGSTGSHSDKKAA